MWGVAVCIALLLFYLFAYFPLIDKIYAEHIERKEGTPACFERSGGAPAWTTSIPLYTGHFFPLFPHFILEGNSVVPSFCQATEPHCVSWVSTELAQEEGLDCLPWIEEEEGVPGCCKEQIMQPTMACEERVEALGFFALLLLLAGVYFIIGAAIGWVVQQRNANRK